MKKKKISKKYDKNTNENINKKMEIFKEENNKDDSFNELQLTGTFNFNQNH